MRAIFLSLLTLGPGQRMVTRWASSHNNTFSFAIVAAADQQWFFHDDYYQMLDDYIALAPPGSNEAVAKPRYHGSSGVSSIVFSLLSPFIIEHFHNTSHQVVRLFYAAMFAR